MTQIEERIYAQEQDGTRRLVRTQFVDVAPVSDPTPEPTAGEKIAILEKRNAALEAALIEKAYITLAEVDAKVGVDVVAVEVVK
jgi:hypothetical protein